MTVVFCMDIRACKLASSLERCAQCSFRSPFPTPTRTQKSFQVSTNGYTDCYSLLCRDAPGCTGPLPGVISWQEPLSTAEITSCQRSEKLSSSVCRGGDSFGCCPSRAGRVGRSGPVSQFCSEGWRMTCTGYWLMLWSSRLAVAQLMLRFVSGAYCKDNFSTYIFLCCRCCGCYSVILLPGSPCIGLLRSCPNGCFHDCIGQPVGGAWCSVNLSRNQ